MRPGPNQFSLVIRPDESVVDRVREMKTQLRGAIGWYASCNSDAHITILEFKDETELNRSSHTIAEFCTGQASHWLHFDSFGSFGDHTYFLAPDDKSKQILTTIVQDLYQKLGIKSGAFTPHISIARKLHEHGRMNATKAFFENEPIDISFECDGLVLRKFDDSARQYSLIEKKFDFGA